MGRFGVVAGGICTLALVAALVPAVATGASVASPGTTGISVDDRKKPKPTKTPKPSKKPRPTKTPTPTLTPFAPVPVQARFIEDWIADQPKDYLGAESTLTYIVEPSLVGSDWERALLRGGKAAFEIHALLGQPVRRPIKVYLGWSWKWLEDTVPKAECPMFFPQQDAGACPPADVVFTRFSGFQQFDPSLSPTSTINSYNKYGISGLLAHEVAHLVQASLYPQKSLRSYPEDNRWLVEGWAMMIQTMASMRAYGISYGEARDLQLRVHDMKCEGVKLRDLLVQQKTNGCEYVSGLLATEYLMWKTGDMRAGWTYVSQDALTSREAFSEAYGLDLDTFMEEAEKYVYRELALWPKREGPK